MTLIGITTSNIRGLPLQKFGPVNLRIALAARQAGVNFGQEIDPTNRTLVRRRSYATCWKQGMAKRHKTTYGSDHEVPVSLPTSVWHVTHAEVHLAHGGLAHVSPARFITEVRATRVTGERVAFFACHPPSKWYKPNATQAAWRREHGEIYMHVLDALVTSAHQAGYTCVFGGDMNHPHPPAIAKGQISLVASGLDHLWVLPAAGYTVRVVKRKKFRATRAMDHPILSARFDLRKAA